LRNEGNEILSLAKRMYKNKITMLEKIKIKKNLAVSEKEIMFEQVAELEEPIRKIIEKIRQRDFYLGKTEIISGEYGNIHRYPLTHTPKIYRKDLLNGVFKDEGDKKSKLRKFKVMDFSENKEDIQMNINKTRKDAGTVTEHLINWYESIKNEK